MRWYISFKTILVLLVVILGLGLLAGCEQNADKTAKEIKWKIYRDKRYGFTFEYPDDWYIDSDPYMSGDRRDEEYIAITSYRQIKHNNNLAPYLNYPAGGVSIVLSKTYYWLGTPPTKLVNHGLPKLLGRRTKVVKKDELINIVSAESAPYRIWQVADIKKNKFVFRFNLRTDNKGKKLGEKTLKRMVKSFKQSKSSSMLSH